MPKFPGRVPPAQKQINPFNLKKILKSASWAELQSCLPKGWRVTEAKFVEGRIASVYIDPALKVELVIYDHKNRGRWA